MTPLALASDLEAKHKALVEAKNKRKNKLPNCVIDDMEEEIGKLCFDNLPTLLTALRESGEAIELRRENEQLKRHLDEANHWREILSNDLVAMSRLIPERKK